MGIIKNAFYFIAGVYLAQNYQIPNLKKLAETALFHAKQTEEKHRNQIEEICNSNKSKKKGGDDG